MKTGLHSNKIHSYPAIGFEVGPQISRGHFLKCSYLVIVAKMHWHKDDRINESVLYTKHAFLHIPNKQYTRKVYERCTYV